MLKDIVLWGWTLSIPMAMLIVYLAHKYDWKIIKDL